MFIITFKGRPATLETVYEAERGAVPFHTGTTERESYLAAPSAAKAKALFIYYIGFTWGERAKGIEVARVDSSALVIQGKSEPGGTTEERVNAKTQALSKAFARMREKREESPGIVPGYAAPGEN